MSYIPNFNNISEEATNTYSCESIEYNLFDNGRYIGRVEFRNNCFTVYIQRGSGNEKEIYREIDIDNDDYRDCRESYSYVAKRIIIEHFKNVAINAGNQCDVDRRDEENDFGYNNQRFLFLESKINKPIEKLSFDDNKCDGLNCNKCGSKLEPEFKYCPYCGEPIES